MDIQNPAWMAPEAAILVRETATHRNGELEVLRTIAVTMVLLEHLSHNLIFWPASWADNLRQSGVWTGVDLFFAISGFVIARSLLPKVKTARDAESFIRVAVEFWIRRAWRIWPSAWLWLAAPLLLCLFFNRSGAYGGFQANWEMAIAGMMNLANFRASEIFCTYPSGTAFVQWSLSLEEQFYLLLPVAAYLLRGWLPAVLALIFAFAFLPPHIPLLMMIRGGSVAAGVLLAIWSRHPSYADCAPDILGRAWFARIGVFAMCIALLVSLGDTQLHIVAFLLGPIAIVSGILVWIASYGRGYLWRPGWPRRGMEILAARSYSLYLIHIPVYFGMHEAWFRLHHLAIPTHRQTILYFAATLIMLAMVTELNHRLVETPLREYGKGVASRFAARTQAEAA
jgi:peptidoglycan/LPS O-acetylase OafA/YrhL